MSRTIVGGVLGGVGALGVMLLLMAAFGAPTWPWNFIVGYALGSFGSRIGIWIATREDRARARYRTYYATNRGDAA